jgi:hypothetical protein
MVAEAVARKWVLVLWILLSGRGGCCVCVGVRRDDLVSAFYVFMDLLLGRLPWADSAKSKDKPAVEAAKMQASAFTQSECEVLLFVLCR